VSNKGKSRGMPCGPPHRGRTSLRCACHRLSAPCGSIVDMADERADPGEAGRDDAPAAGSVRAAVEAPGAPSDVVRAAKAALATGQAWKARDLLEDHLEQERDPQAMKLLGEVLHRMGDLPGAGAAWFATSAKGPLIDEAIAAWRADHDDDFVAMWTSIPASARREPLTPKLSALRAKALEAKPDLDDAHPSDARTSDVKPAKRTPSAGAMVEAPAQATPSQSAMVESPAKAQRKPEAAKSPDQGSKDSLRDESASSWKGGNRHAGTDGKDAAVEGFDAAKVIAWILAALFVVCAVVGLITILQWIVPGS